MMQLQKMNRLSMNSVLKIPGIRECHYFKVNDSKNILISKTSQSLMEKIPIFKENVSCEESFDEDLIIQNMSLL